MSTIHVLELSKYTQPEIVENTRNAWVEYGEDNDYYEWLMCRYRNSTTNNAIINNMARLIYGKGIDARDASRKPNDYAQMKMLFSNDTLRKCALEVKLFGGYALQIIYSKDRKRVAKVEHLPIYLTRPEKCDENGDINGYYYSDNWEDTKKFVPKYIPSFGSSNEPLEILVIGQYSVGRKYFHRVDYEGCLDYCVLEEKISEFLINDVTNSFSGTKVINFNNGKGTPEQQQEQVNKVKGKLTGSTGDKVIISFNDNPESKTTIDDVPLDNAPEHYSYLATEARNKILAGHTVTSPMLVGISPDGQGFSSNADEINTGALYFYNTAIKPLQELLIEGLEKVLAFNGVTLDLYFKRLNLLEDLEATQQANEVAMSSHQCCLSSDEDSKLDLLADLLIEKGEDENMEGWVLVDERDVDYSMENELDLQLENYKPKQNFLQKLASAVKAIPNAKSSQDKVVKDIQWKVRYKYAGNVNPQREFCKKMMNASKIYRREDLDVELGAVDGSVVNSGLEHKGSPYNIFLFAGGARCKHYFKRLTFASIDGAGIDVTSPNAKQVQTQIASKRGYKITNPYQVSVPKNQLPHKGFHPDNENMPSDAR